MTSKTTRQLTDVVRDLAQTARVIHSKADKLSFGRNDLLAHLYRACSLSESYGEQFLALDGLAHQLLKHQMYHEAAKVSGYALELLNGIHALPLDGPEVLLAHCYLLAKHSHASSNCGDFSAVIKADQELGRALMAALRCGADIPATKPGMNGLVDHMVISTCASPIPLLLTYSAAAEHA